MKLILSFVLILTHLFSYSQLVDDFTDGDFTNNPIWSGTDTEFIINPTFQVQLNNTIAGASYLTTPHGLATLDNKEWNIWTKQSFSPSGSNFGRVYLTSSNADLTTDPDGFYLQLGEAGSNDAVRLFKVVSNVHTEILAGTLGQIATSSTLGLRVVRDNLGNWSLYIDDTGGTAYVLAGTVNDGTVLLGTHFGFIDTYTSSNSTKFYYDNVYVGDEIVDVAPPILVSATAINANLIDVLFNEPLDQVSAETIGNYDIQPFLSATTATLDGTNPALVHIIPTASLINGNAYVMFTNNIADVSGNISGSQSANFSYLIPEIPAAGDVIINEFLCDPTPQVGLANAEFVEIYNKSNKIFDVSNWKIGDASSDGTATQGWLLPGEYMILSSTANVDSFTVATGVTSFPSLNNSGDAIVLRSDLGVILDSIYYTSDWYHDQNKDGGGYTIERINPNAPCSGEDNWSASNDNLGGTPGLQNSIYDITPDTQTPTIDKLIALAPNFVEVYFTEGMDSTSLADATITINPLLTIQNQYVLSEGTNLMTLQFNENLAPSQVYAIELQNVADCWLNATILNGVFALSESPIMGDLIINEILPDPLTGGGDYVEMYNNSDKLLDIYNWEIGNFDNDTIDNLVLIDEHFLIYPGEYLVFAKDVLQVIQDYSAAEPNRLMEVSLPTFPNDSGTVYLQFQGATIDKVSYNDEWHFKLLDNYDGKSLERLDFNGNSSDRNNWHTAAEAIGFGTPGRVNSQYYPALTNGDFNYTSETVSPDNDGFEDVLQVNYTMAEPGYTGTFTIYDDRGRLVAEVMKSELLGMEGTFIWDGITKEGNKVSIGTYIGIFEAFLTNSGDVFVKKAVFTVAGRL